MPNPRNQFRQNVQQAIANEVLQSALDHNAKRRKEGRQQAFDSLGEDLDTLRTEARRIRQEVIQDLDSYLRKFVDQCRKHGIVVHFARDADTARQIVLQIAANHDAQLVAKSKSMLSEEIHLNPALEANGIRVVETDLGEFIVQLRSESPSHILTPAVHLNRHQVSATFNEHFSLPITDDIRTLNDEARKQLRDVFLKADIGVSGVNFGVAESGTLCLLTNEGNGRMVTTLPHIHIALMGIERLVPTFEDLSLMLKLLPRSATGQKITSYVSMIQSPRHPEDQDGPQERHLVLVDNHRRSLIDTPMEEALNCIRCGACLNACPVFQEIGGHAYDSVYPGPIGSVLSPALFGVQAHGHLAKASSLCGACMDACPVKIDFPALLLRTRSAYVREVRQPTWMRLGMRMFRRLMVAPRLYDLSQKFLQLAAAFLPKASGWHRQLPPPFNRWTKSRDFPAIPAKTFRQSWLARSGQDIPLEPVSVLEVDKPAIETAAICAQDEGETASDVLINRLEETLLGIDAEVHHCTQDEFTYRLLGVLEGLNARTVLVDSGQFSQRYPEITSRFKDNDITSLSTRLMLKNHARQEGIQWLSQADAGLTGCLGVLADTGSLILVSGSERSQLASLLPPVHIAVVRTEQIYQSFDDWLRNSNETIADYQAVTLVSGPSRTADIEMTLTIGVHGPKRLIVFIVSD